MKKIKKLIAIGTILYIAFSFGRIAYAESASKSVSILIKVVPAVTSSEDEKIVDIKDVEEGTTSTPAPKPITKNVSQTE